MAYSTILLDAANPGQRDALVKLWTENMSDRRIGEVTAARLQWFYEENPVRPPRTILSLHGEREVIGCGSTFPRRIWTRGRIVDAGVPCDFAVTKRHRLGGAAMGIQQALIADSVASGQQFLFGFPNKASLPILKRVGYRIVADAPAWVKPLRSFYKVRAYLKNRDLARAASWVVDAGIRTVDLLRTPDAASNYSDEILARADERFDALWARARLRYRMIGEKTSAFLNWRYTAFKTREHRFFTLIDRATGRVTGFVVFSVEDGKVFVTDVFAQNLDSMADVLIMRFAARMRRLGHVSIFLSYAGDPGFGRRIESLGFMPSAHRDRSLVVLAGKDLPPQLAGDLEDRESWLMFDGEMDI